MELLPESHVSPRLASKILFCGKAVKLLLTANKTESVANIPQLKIIFNYLSRGSFPSNSISSLSSGISSSSQGPRSKNSLTGIFPTISSERKNTDDHDDDDSDNDNDNDANNNQYGNKNKNEAKNRNKNKSKNKNNEEKDEILNYTSQCGFETKDIERITTKFHRVLNESNIAIQLFESMIEDVHKTLSGKLWFLLKEKYGFSNFLLSMRNTFLMGKGELYQLILDGILDQTKKEIQDADKVDKILKFDILKKASKMLNLDDDLLTSTLELRINAANVRIVDFTHNTGIITLSGGAKYEKIEKNIPIGKKKSNRKVLLCTIVEEDSLAELSKLWSKNVLRKYSELKHDCSNNKIDINDINLNKYKNEDKNNYTVGAIWLSGQKYVPKGFTSSCSFEASWSSVRETVTMSHPQFTKGEPTVVTDDDDNYNNNISNNNNNSNSNSNRNIKLMNKNDVSILSEEGSSLFVRSDASVLTKNNETDKSRKQNESRKLEKGAGHLLLGGLSCVVHSDKEGTQVACAGDLGLKFQGSITVGVSFHGIDSTLYIIFYLMQYTFSL